MRFKRELLNHYLDSLLASSDAQKRCIGHNILIEENVSNERRVELEGFKENPESIAELFEANFLESVQGPYRGHKPSTWNMRVNYPALLPVNVHPDQKLIRLENIDSLIKPQSNGIDYDNLVKVLEDGAVNKLNSFIRKFRAFPGERPTFAAFERDMRPILQEPNWLPSAIDCLGLFQNYTQNPKKRKHFALMEYTAAEVIEQARAKGIEHCFALPTVLEALNNPAFCPVPRSTGHGLVVNLRGIATDSPIREILHIRFDYLPRHVKFLGVWHGRDTPDIMAMRGSHLIRVRGCTGRSDFGREWEWR